MTALFALMKNLSHALLPPPEWVNASCSARGAVTSKTHVTLHEKEMVCEGGG